MCLVSVSGYFLLLIHYIPFPNGDFYSEQPRAWLLSSAYLCENSTGKKQRHDMHRVFVAVWCYIRVRSVPVNSKRFHYGETWTSWCSTYRWAARRGETAEQRTLIKVFSAWEQADAGRDDSRNQLARPKLWRELDWPRAGSATIPGLHTHQCNCTGILLMHWRTCDTRCCQCITYCCC